MAEERDLVSTCIKLRSDQMQLLRKAHAGTRVAITQYVRDAVDLYFSAGPGRAVLEYGDDHEQYDLECARRLLEEARNDLVKAAENLRSLSRKTRKLRLEARDQRKAKAKERPRDAQAQEEGQAA